MAGYTALGASAAVADYDGDGFDDVFVTDSKADGKNHLYHNNGNFTFTDVAEKAGVANGNDAKNASADALWLDFNNDGRPDLLVVRFGQNQLFENLGNGKFRGRHAEGRARPATRTPSRRSRSITITTAYVDLFVGTYFQPVNIFQSGDAALFPGELRDREQRRRRHRLSQQRQRHVHRRHREGRLRS